MHKKSVFPGTYIQGPGAVGELIPLMESLGGKGLILASPSVVKNVIPNCGLDLKARKISVERFGGECCEDELARIHGVVSHREADVLVGMGGGKTVDAAKIVADRMDIPVIIVPTIASTDAPCSRCAVVYTKNGVFESVFRQKRSPAAVVVDLDIISKAPTRYLVAGMGDALSTWFEARSCYRTHSMNECGGHCTEAALRIARLCHEILMTHGAAAKAANDAHEVTPALDQVVEASVLLSGLGFESGGLASAHSIHNGLTVLTETHPFLHGEKVAFGVLAGLHVTHAPYGEMEEAFSFSEEVGLPTTLADIGLDKAAREMLLPAASRACDPEQPIHHEAGIVTPEKVLDALLAADAMGRARRREGFPDRR